MAWKSLWYRLYAVWVCIGLASPAAAADQGKLTVTAPTAITSSASFFMTVNYANTGSAPIYDPDTVLDIWAYDAAGRILPLAPDKVTVTAPGTPTTEWGTDEGREVTTQFWPQDHESLQPGWNYNLQATVKIIVTEQPFWRVI